MHSNKRNVVVTRGLLVLVACKGGGTGGARGALAPPPPIFDLRTWMLRADHRLLHSF